MMHQHPPAPQACLEASEIIDFRSPSVQRKAAEIAARSGSASEIIEKSFIFVRDGIAHSVDCGGTAVTCSASEALRVGEGLCYAKAHLLAALLRANGIAACFCYQLLGFEDERDPHRVLHGLNAVWLADRRVWRRLDARGDKPGVDARCCLSGPERLAFTVHPQFGEVDFPQIFAAPDPGVILALRTHASIAQLLPRLPQGLTPPA